MLRAVATGAVGAGFQRDKFTPHRAVKSDVICIEKHLPGPKRKPLFDFF